MKQWFTALCVFIIPAARAQKVSFAAIDWHMQHIEAATPDSLGRIIADTYTADIEKVRAIYSWVAGHIAYNTAIYKPRSARYVYDADPLDTAAIWPSGDEMAARKVMRRRTAVCEGYARLFKVVCQYAGVEAEVVHGYGRANGFSAKNFRTNHSWNAVKIDSAWHLLDLTWASGFIDGNDDYVARQNDFYFLTPPHRFLADHFPEDLRWTLLTDLPPFSEFKKAPFRSKNFYKYEVASYFPKAGVIEVGIGDTVVLSVELKDIEKAARTGSDPFTDTADFALAATSAFVKPFTQTGSKLIFWYVAHTAHQWLNLVFNNDVILRYRITTTTPLKKEVAAASGR